MFILAVHLTSISFPHNIFILPKESFHFGITSSTTDWHCNWNLQKNHQIGKQSHWRKNRQKRKVTYLWNKINSTEKEREEAS